MLSSQQLAGYGDQGQLNSSIDHCSCMKSYWGENTFVCVLAVVWYGTVFSFGDKLRQTSCNPPRTAPHHAAHL